jgi:hypothetical protein
MSNAAPFTYRPTRIFALLGYIKTFRLFVPFRLRNRLFGFS